MPLSENAPSGVDARTPALPDGGVKTAHALCRDESQSLWARGKLSGDGPVRRVAPGLERLGSKDAAVAPTRFRQGPQGRRKRMKTAKRMSQVNRQEAEKAPRHHLGVACFCALLAAAGILLPMALSPPSRCDTVMATTRNAQDAPSRLEAAGCGAEARQVMLDRAGFPAPTSDGRPVYRIGR